MSLMEKSTYIVELIDVSKETPTPVRRTSVKKDFWNQLLKFFVALLLRFSWTLFQAEKPQQLVLVISNALYIA